MPYKYAVAPGYQPPRLVIPVTPEALLGKSYWTYAGPSQVALAPGGIATRTTYERGQVRQIPILRVLPATPTDNEAQSTALVKYSPEHLHPNRLPRPIVAPVSQNTVSRFDRAIAYNSPPPLPQPLRSGGTRKMTASGHPLRPVSASSPPPLHQAVQPMTPERPAAMVAESSIPLSKERASHQAINDIVRELHNCTVSFQRPSDLDFEFIPSSPAALPRLARTTKNAPLLEQTQKLKSMQDKLKSVHSHGDRGVRKARKEAVAQVERALEDLKRTQVMIWNKVSCH